MAARAIICGYAVLLLLRLGQCVVIVHESREGDSGFADAAVIIVVKVIQRCLLHSLFAHSVVQVRPVVVKRVKVLSHAIHQSLEARVRFGARSV